MQVGPAVNEDRLIGAFREYGMVTGWKFLRRSNCAFIDFDTRASAAAALEALHGVNFNGCQIRIEFKDERGQSMPAPGGRGPQPRGGRFPPSAYSPGRPGWLPSHRSSGPRDGPVPTR
jgi:RNA recognition motif-containing protein